MTLISVVKTSVGDKPRCYIYHSRSLPSLPVTNRKSPFAAVFGSAGASPSHRNLERWCEDGKEATFDFAEQR
jgi:hypothetical protein